MNIFFSHCPQMKFPSGYNSSFNRYKNAILLILSLVLVTILSLDYMRDNLPFLWRSREINVDVPVPRKGSSSSILHHRFNHNGSINGMSLGKNCNLFKGRWVPFPQAPYYTNNSGCVIEDNQNCMKFGRPDTDFMKLRWKPDDCEIPIFDAVQFLEFVRGKSMAFLGDSVARNQMQSLGCMLSSAAHHTDLTDNKHPRFRRWFYKDYNFTLGLLLTTHLVKTLGVNSMISMSTVQLYLDEVDQAWASHIQQFDYVIISTGHWFTRPLVYYENRKVVGCSMCSRDNTRDLGKYYGYRKAYKTAFNLFLDHDKFKGSTVIMRTITPSHFEAEESDDGGNCVRIKPMMEQEMKMEWDLFTFYLIQMEEFWAAQRVGKKRGMKFKLLDITEMMRPRADAHPNHYGHAAEVRFMLYSDCLHWCLPGAIDIWNELLFQILKTEDYDSS
ncbi:protein trichome birefringence-like 19 [Diospyros lotus]|uniref:protein trichome birefringence-like 19 n=1 Tax=Diospyros lotus TaxID=55363 RepID=UPI0022593D40|nr:protein trichome birefringence-like 19 [Diospyros lotus]